MRGDASCGRILLGDNTDVEALIMRAINFRCVGVRISNNNRPQVHLLGYPQHSYCVVLLIYIAAALWRAVLIVDIVRIT